MTARLFCALLCLHLPLAAAQALPGTLAAKPKATADKAGAQIDPASLSTLLEDKLAQTRRRVAALPPAEAAPPAGVTAPEWKEQRWLLEDMQRTLQLHKDALVNLGKTGRLRQETEQAATEWSGFTQPPPYEIGFVDDLGTQVRNKAQEANSVRIELELMTRLLADSRTELEKALQALRQTGEQAESVQDPAQPARWRLSLAELRKEYFEARAGMLDTSRRVQEEKIALLQAEQKLLQLKLSAASRASTFSAGARDASRAALAAEREKLDRQVQQSIATSQAALERRARLLAGQPAAATPEAAQGLRRELDVAQIEADYETAALRILRILQNLAASEEQVWELRFEEAARHDTLSLERSLQSVVQYMERLHLLRDHVRNESERIGARLADLRKRLAEWQPAYGDKALGGRELKASEKMEVVLRGAEAKIFQIESLLLNWQIATKAKIEGSTWKERAAGWYAAAAGLAGRTWQYELIAVEDKIEVEGREIVGKRSVTVGKAAKALVILSIGLAITTWLANRGRRRLLAWLPGRESAALLGVRLFSLAMVLGLVVFSLLAVNIPLTAFAFMGGALAIGIGFGAQNIINNFISGLILLVEKPIKLGDIVEVEGIRGRVSNIGSRCCLVSRADGVDMLIPNSSFLEKSVTNWTLSDRKLRFGVNVGVAYGAPLPEAMRLLRLAAHGNPAVLDNPAPEVQLEDFGDNAQVLRVEYWLDMAVSPDFRKVASEIRQAIGAAFAANGIEISFPQRDIHLDSRTPLQVEVVQQPGKTPA